MIEYVQGNRVTLDKEHWYEHLPKSEERSQEAKITRLWNQQVQTDRTIPNKKPDFIICYNEKGTRMIRCCNCRRQKCDKGGSREDSKI